MIKWAFIEGKMYKVLKQNKNGDIQVIGKHYNKKFDWVPLWYLGKDAVLLVE